jgi:hypothetical protein
MAATLIDSIETNKSGQVTLPRMFGWGTGIRTPIDGSKVRSPAVGRSPIGALIRCRGPDLNWGHQHFQCCALPTELPRRIATTALHQKGRPCGRPLRERAMRFELTTFSLARRRSTTELRPHIHPVLQSHPSLAHMPAGRWTRSDSNRRSSPCKGDAFPLGHGPLNRPHRGADERTRTSTPFGNRS